MHTGGTQPIPFRRGALLIGVNLVGWEVVEPWTMMLSLSVYSGDMKHYWPAI